MRQEGNYILCKLSELAGIIARNIDLEKPKNSRLPNFSFAADTDTTKDESLETVFNNSNAWYGIHVVNTGFDSDDLHLVSDYYGGGAPKFVHIFQGMSLDQVRCAILMAISGTMSDMGDLARDNIVIVELSKNKDLRTEIIVEVYEGMVVDVFCTDNDASVSVIDRDTQDPEEEKAIDIELKNIRKLKENHEIYSIW